VNAVVLQDLIDNYSFDNPHIWALLAASAVAFGFGYWVYFWAIRILLKEKRSAYPVWMHTFYLACDITGTVFWFLLAQDNDWFWFFSFSSAAMSIWVLCEIWCLYMAVKWERQEIWGDQYVNPVTPKQAISNVVVQTVMFLTVVNLMNYFFGGLQDAAMFKWYVWTNFLVALGPLTYWAKHRDLRRAPFGLGVMILASIIATYLPPGLGMWTTASPYFNTPWFYIAGVVTTVIAVKTLFDMKRWSAIDKDSAPVSVS
jgi:hypothetical protein